jgi:hypothetical protein
MKDRRMERMGVQTVRFDYNTVKKLCGLTLERMLWSNAQLLKPKTPISTDYFWKRQIVGYIYNTENNTDKF